jgi:hypothetical protein
MYACVRIGGASDPRLERYLKQGAAAREKKAQQQRENHARTLVISKELRIKHPTLRPGQHAEEVHRRLIAEKQKADPNYDVGLDTVQRWISDDRRARPKL